MESPPGIASAREAQVMLSESTRRPWRRHVRFSMRGLILFVLVIGGGLGWIVRLANIQRNAVAAIQNSGGSV